jgi:uncharacterized membrane protein
VNESLITSNVGVLAVLTGVCAFYFWLEKRSQWRLFQYVPPLVFIYLTPVILANSGSLWDYAASLGDGRAPGSAATASDDSTSSGVRSTPTAAAMSRDVLPSASPAYSAIKEFALPMMLVLMLLNVDLARAVSLAGRGVGVMLFGACGVVVGAVLGFVLVKQWLGPDAWKGYSALTGSWVGGTGNMAAVGAALKTPDTELALAVLADTTILLIWLPVMLSSKKFADGFAKFARVDAERVLRMDEAAKAELVATRPALYYEYLYLLAVAFAAAWAAEFLKTKLPIREPALTVDVWRILLITTIGIGLSFTPLRRIPASRELGMALIFLFMATMGATADLAGTASQAIPFLVGAVVCIVTHGAFTLLGAKLLHVDIHTAAVASAANIGGVATASCVAAHHKEGLMPAAILLALLGYAVGNYAGLLTAYLCRLVA